MTDRQLRQYTNVTGIISSVCRNRGEIVLTGGKELLRSKLLLLTAGTVTDSNCEGKGTVRHQQLARFIADTYDEILKQPRHARLPDGSGVVRRRAGQVRLGPLLSQFGNANFSLIMPRSWDTPFPRARKNTDQAFPDEHGYEQDDPHAKPGCD